MFKALNRAFNIKVFNIKSYTWASWSFEIKKYQNGAPTEECRMSEFLVFLEESFQMHQSLVRVEINVPHLHLIQVVYGLELTQLQLWI
jgi:hypothetical protein